MLIFLKNQIIMFVLFLLFSTCIALSNETSDIIYLKNGTKVTGKIIKFEVDKEVVIKTESGSELLYKMSDVDKIDFLSKSLNQKRKRSAEFGLTLGSPAGINLVLARHIEKVIVKATGFYLGYAVKGIQLELGYKFSEYDRTYNAFNIVAGIAEYGEKDRIDLHWSIYNYTSWKYIGIVYNLNTNGFYLQSGLSIGEGDFTNPQLLLQVGYVYQYR